ncbi:MAG: DUF6240 domain-containing protein [Butyrivibrio sp.]|nr:DUF6240 domain-containing protein [Butyrivibrio sp.]
MNINFLNATGEGTNNQEVRETVRDYKVRPSFGAGNRVSMPGAYAVDLDSSMISNNAYGNQGKTTEQVQAEAGNTDVQMQQNFKTLLSNTMTPEDYMKAAEDGYDVKDMDPQETVTIVDKIKAVMAQSGEVVSGYNDDINSAKLEKIMGSKSLANQVEKSFSENDVPLTSENIADVKEALELSKDINKLSDGTTKYMILNQTEPTIENLYMAIHSTNGQNKSGKGFYMMEAGGYYAQKADSTNLSGLKDQIDKVIEEAGFDVSDENLQKDARWLIEESIPLVPENLQKFEEIKNIEFPITNEKVIESSARAISEGKKAPFGNVFQKNSDINKAIDIYEKVSEVSTNDIKQVISDNKKLNLENIFSASENDIKLATNVSDNNIEFIQARKQMEEIRLSMTITANYSLLKKGFQIETAPLKELIDNLQKTIDEAAGNLFGKTNDNTTIQVAAKYSLLEESISKISDLHAMPAAVIARIEDGKNGDTLDRIYQKAEITKGAFDKAGFEYEKLMTAPRADLGDSIKKAFRNTDEILTELNEKITEENQRAVRILGYNRMEITPENIERVRSIDLKLTDTVKKLNPGSVLEMIREGKNPLKMTLDELGQEMDQGKNESKESNEKFAKFLYKMEQNADITKEEKETFIGIYRLFNNLNKTDNSAIGTVLESGAEMTIENLLTAMRTQKKSKSGIDVKVNDSFGGIDLVRKNGNVNISEQIEKAFTYYSQKSDVVYNNLEPEKLHEAKANNNSLLDELADKLLQTEERKEADLKYYEQESREVREILDSRSYNEVSQELAENNISVTVSSVEAMMRIRTDRRRLADRFSDKALELASRAVRSKEQQLVDEMGEVDDFKLSYGQHMQDAISALEEITTDSVDSYIDIKAITLMQKQLSVRAQMAENDSYEIPVEVDGTEVNMHVVLKREENEGTKIETSVHTPYYGTLTAAFAIDEDKVRGIVSTTMKQEEDVKEYIEQVRDRLLANIAESSNDFRADSQDMMVMYNVSDSGRLITGSENGISDTNSLLGLAKAFIKAL